LSSFSQKLLALDTRWNASRLLPQALRKLIEAFF
jgi:hypothetical protein